MSEVLWGVIIGGVIGGAVGILTAVIGNRAAAKRQREMFEHQSKENEKAFQREILNHKISTYNLVLANLSNVHQLTIKQRSEDDPKEIKKYKDEFWEKLNFFIVNLPVHSVFLDEQTVVDCFKLAEKPFFKEDPDLIGKTILLYIDKLIKRIKREIDRLCGIQPES